MGSSVQNFVNLGSDKKCPPPLRPQTVAKEMSDYVQSLSRLIRCTFLKILRQVELPSPNGCPARSDLMVYPARALRFQLFILYLKLL